MLKKLNLLILIFAMLISCVTVYGAQNNPKAETEPDGIVYALNITNKKDAKKTVTRGDAAGIVLRLFGYDASVMENGEIFDDVSIDDDNGSAIYTAYKLGIVSGAEGDSYEPDENVTYEQLAKMLVTALGYEQRASTLGGYPSGYVLVASMLKLDKNVEIENNEKLDVETVSQIAENALDVEVYTNINGKYSSEDKETLLYRAFKLRKYNGIVTAVYGTSYTPHSYAVEKDDVYINDTKYKTGEFDIQNLVGYNVDFYVRDDSDEPQTVVYAKKKESKALEIEPDNIKNVTIDRRGIYFDYYKTSESKRSYEAEIYFDKTSLIYNGYYTDVTKVDKDLFEFSDGKIKLIDYDNDGGWDFISVERVTTAVVKNYSTETGVLSFEYPVELGTDYVSKLNFKEYDRILFNGEESYPDVQQGDVLDINIPKNDVFSDKNIRLNAARKIIRSEFTKKKSEDGRNYIEIDGIAYRLSDDYEKYAPTVFDGLQFGVEYTLYLTESGKIAYIISHINEERVYGYLTNMAVDSFGKVSMKVYMDDGKFHYFDFADKVKVYRDGVYEGSKASENAVAHLFNGDKFDLNQAQLIRFLPDRDTKVTLIEFAQNEMGTEAAAEGHKNGSFIKSRSKFEGYYFHVSRIVYTAAWLPVFAFPESAVCFTVPDNPDELNDEDYFSVGSYSGQRGNITLDTYNDDESGIPEVLVNYGGADKYLGFAYSSSMVVVKEVMRSINDDGELVDVVIDVTGKSYYAEVGDEVFVDKSTGEPLKCGDVIQIIKSSGNYVKHIDILFFTDENAPNGYGYTYTAPGTPVRNTADKIIAVGDLDDDRLIASGYVKALAPNYVTIVNDAGEEAVFRINSSTINLYTVFRKSENIVVENIDQLNLDDYVVIKCAQSRLSEVMRYFD